VNIHNIISTHLKHQRTQHIVQLPCYTTPADLLKQYKIDGVAQSDKLEFVQQVMVKSANFQVADAHLCAFLATQYVAIRILLAWKESSNIGSLYEVVGYTLDSIVQYTFLCIYTPYGHDIENKVSFNGGGKVMFEYEWKKCK